MCDTAFQLAAGCRYISFAVVLCLKNASSRPQLLTDLLAQVVKFLARLRESWKRQEIKKCQRILKRTDDAIYLFQRRLAFLLNSAISKK